MRFTKIRENTVEIEHFSTASVIKITFTYQEPKNQQGDMEEIVTEQWFSYDQFSDLKRAINLIDDDENTNHI